LLGHVAKPKDWSRLRLREPRRLPRGLTREESALLGSFRTWRDRAIPGLMLLSGLRSAEVFGLLVADVDIARRWLGASPDRGLKPWRIETSSSTPIHGLRTSSSTWSGCISTETFAPIADLA
jgi:integrase